MRKLIALLALPVVAAAQQTPDTTFHPISMAEAVRLAHENNVSNITANNSVRSASNQVRSARAQFLPSLTATAGQNKTFGSRLGERNTLIPIDPKWGYTTGLRMNMTLFDAGKTFADIRAQKANVAAAEASEVNTEYNIALQVKQAYNAVLAAKESESAARAQLATAELQLQTSIAKVNAGAANISDSLRSVVQVGTAQLAVLSAQNTFRTQSATLTRLVGTPYFVTAQLSDSVDHSTTPIDSANIVTLAESGPTIRAANAEMSAAKASERSAKAAYLPTITMNASFSGSGASSIYGFNGAFPYSRGIGFNLNYPIFNGFQRENQIASAQIAFENAQASARDARLSTQQSVVTGIGNLRNAEETMRVQEVNVRASQEDLRVVTQRYQNGVSTLLEVTTSQQNLVTAQQQLIQARLNYRNAKAQIEAAIGRDLP
jgi:outer membrane protein